MTWRELVRKILDTIPEDRMDEQALWTKDLGDQLDTVDGIDLYPKKDLELDEGDEGDEGDEWEDGANQNDDAYIIG